MVFPEFFAVNFIRCIALASASTLNLAAGIFSFTDTTFANPDWLGILIYDNTPGGASFSAAQSGTGGNPGAWRETTHTYASGQMAVGQVNQVFGFSPLIQGGAIGTVSFGYDFEVLDAGASLAVAHGVLLAQGGKYFVADYQAQFPGGGWVNHSGTGLTAADFTEYDGSVHPDFSAPLAFGYVTANGTAGGLTGTDHGIDNYTVTFTTVPEPAAWAWMAGSGIGLLGWRLLRRRLR